jgi:2-isopropylmalate synthase
MSHWSEKLRSNRVSHYISEIANMHHRQDFRLWAKSAFAHKGGIHVSAVMKEPRAYEHVAPETVGNERRVLISELSGKSNVLYKAERMGVQIDKTSSGTQAVVNKLKEMEHYGYQFEGAEASFEILFSKLMNEHSEFFELDGFRVITERKGTGLDSEAVIKLCVDGTEEHCRRRRRTRQCARSCFAQVLTTFPCIKDIRLTDYKVRSECQGSNRRESPRAHRNSDGHETWGPSAFREH